MSILLYEKMCCEQEEYRRSLLTQKPARILSHAEEYAARQMLLTAVRTCNWPDKLCVPLFEMDAPLKYCYRYWRLNGPDNTAMLQRYLLGCAIDAAHDHLRNEMEKFSCNLIK